MGHTVPVNGTTLPNYIEVIEAKALMMFIRVYSLFKNELLCANINKSPIWYRLAL